MKTDNELLQELSEAKSRIAAVEAELEARKKPKGRWKPAKGERYNYFSGIVLETTNTETRFDNFRIATGNIFQTKEKIEAHVRYLCIHTQLLDLAGDYVPDWGEGYDKYYGYWHHVKGVIEYSFSRGIQQPNIVYFPSRESCQAAYDSLAPGDAEFYLTYSMQG